MNTILYLSYGSGPHNDELLYSVISALHFLGRENKDYQIVIYTDNPPAYEHLPVRVEPITPETLASWAGPLGFIHRRKIFVLKAAFEKYGGRIAYLDADTYFQQHPAKLFKLIDEGNSVLHRREAHLDRCHAVELADFLMDYPLTRPDGSRWDITANTWMWNAGVIGMHHGDAWILDEVVHLNDQIYPHVRLDTIEQFAFTAALGVHTRLRECPELVFHYYHADWRVPFRQHMERIFHHTPGLEIEDQFRALSGQRPVYTTAHRLRLRIGRIAARFGISNNKNRAFHKN